MIGTTLDGRYHILRLLGTGKHGQTYLAEDRQAQGHPHCVVKQFEPEAQDTLSLRKVKYLFAREIKIQKILAKSDRIPNLIGHFRQENKFYLVHQFIDGTDLAQELGSGKQWTAEQVVGLLREILEIVEVAHREKVIHQDIKPSNIIRRKSDGKLILIDFGSVKKLHNLMANAEGNTSLSVPIGTEGYMAPEQKSIKPKLASDIYAVGAIAIYALTGVEPKDIPLERDTEKVQWRDLVSVDEKLAKVLDRMVDPDFRQRYPSASEALNTVRNLKLGKKLSNLNISIVAGTIFLAILGAGYYYWQLEMSLNKTLDSTGYFEAEKNQFPFLYRNSEYGIEMKYPSSWKLERPNQNQELAQFKPQESQSDLIPPQVSIEVAQSGVNSLEEYTTNAVYQITKLPEAKIIDSRPIKFGEGDGHKIIYTGVNPDNNLPLKYLQIWTLRGDRVYIITYQADLEQYDSFEETVENEMLKTIKITPTS